MSAAASALAELRRRESVAWASWLDHKLTCCGCNVLLPPAQPCVRGTCAAGKRLFAAWGRIDKILNPSI